MPSSVTTEFDLSILLQAPNFPLRFCPHALQSASYIDGVSVIFDRCRMHIAPTLSLFVIAVTLTFLPSSTVAKCNPDDGPKSALTCLQEENELVAKSKFGRKWQRPLLAIQKRCARRFVGNDVTRIRARLTCVSKSLKQ